MAGDDAYYISSWSYIIEEVAGGIDTVFSSIPYTLPANVENLVLTDYCNSGSGNQENNFITGNGADNWLNGSGGIDTSLYLGRKGDFTVRRDGDYFRVIDNRTIDGSEGQDNLINIEIIQFLDEAVNLANNKAPTGEVIISGVFEKGQVLKARSTLADLDGIGTITYQWQYQGQNITGEINDSLTLSQNQVGTSVTVTASYTDGFGVVESITSSPTNIVVDTIDVLSFSPSDDTTGVDVGSNIVLTFGEAIQRGTGSIEIRSESVTGNVVETFDAETSANLSLSGSTLTINPTSDLGYSTLYFVTIASGSIKDSAGSNFAGTTSYHFNTRLQNFLPTGSVTITGAATQGQTLTAANTLADRDGVGIISYQWKADGSDISGATDNTYVLTQSQVGKAITVKASFTDGQQTAENMTSAATSAVASSNAAPMGSVTISGTATQGQTLTAAHTLADAEGMINSTLSYQWLLDGVSISGAVGNIFTLTQAQVGKAISVMASYTDDANNAESKTSAATSVIANVNDAPTGAVTISGTVTQGQTLTVNNSLADLDGLGAISYQWKASGTAISGATNSTLVLSQAEVGKVITVVASYTDGSSQAESVSSSATASVANIDIPNLGTSPMNGHIYDWKTHTLINNVDVKLTSPNSVTNLASKTGVDGTFGFEPLDAGSYKLEVSKALTTAETGSAINSADALAALKIAVGRNPNADPDGAGPLQAPAVSPYQFIAADANQDGKITSADALAILKMAVKRTDAPAKEWLFVNENQDFWNETTSSFTTTKASVLWDKVLQVSSPLTTQQNVVAVLKGDVNGSWVAPTGSQDLDITTPAYFTDLAAKLGTQVNQWAVIG
ncbi:SbsA, Ig-like domain containing protein [Burkholderiaceae bacterium]